MQITIEVETTSRPEQYILRTEQYGKPFGEPVIADGAWDLGKAVEAIIKERFQTPAPQAADPPPYPHPAHRDAQIGPETEAEVDPDDEAPF